MSTCPIPKVVANRPPTDALNGNMRRRSSTQVKKDLEAKNFAKAAVEWSINTDKHQQQAHIANLEDILRKEDILWEKESIRPDLQAYDNNQVNSVSTWPEPEDVDELSYEAVDDCDYSDVVASKGDLILFAA